MNNDDLSIK